MTDLSEESLERMMQYMRERTEDDIQLQQKAMHKAFIEMQRLVKRYGFPWEDLDDR